MTSMIPFLFFFLFQGLPGLKGAKGDAFTRTMFFLGTPVCIIPKIVFVFLYFITTDYILHAVRRLSSVVSYKQTKLIS